MADRTASTARRVSASVLAVVAMLLAPVSLVAGWAWSQVSDTDRFVATYAPLAGAPEVHQLLSTTLTEEIVGRLGVAGRLPATRQAVANATLAVVSSDAMDAAWTASLRLTHAQVVSLLSGEAGTVELNDGALQLQLGPFAEAVTQRLIGAGVPFAHLIPEVNAAVTIVQLDADTVARARLGYRVLAAAATWLPWLVLVLAIAVVLLWPTRRGGLVLAGTAALLGAALLAAGLTQVAPLVAAGTPARIGPVADLLVTAALGGFSSPTLALLLAGAATLFTGAMSCPERGR